MKLVNSMSEFRQTFLQSINNIARRSEFYSFRQKCNELREVLTQIAMDTFVYAWFRKSVIFLIVI